MRPISFACEETLPFGPEAIAERILDLSSWPGFKGCAFVPGIREATFADRTPEVVGSRIAVTNTDGSTHVEEIVRWEPDRLLVLEMKDFSAPLSRLASRFVETWELEPLAVGTRVRRSFRLYPLSAAARPILWLISRLLRPAVARHLAQMRGLHRRA